MVDGEASPILVLHL